MIISERMVAAREPQAASVAQETAAAEADAGAALAKLGLAATGALALEACGGGSGSSGGGTPPPVLSSTQASRFLSQSAIGYSHADITSVSTSGIDAWLTAQFAMARPQKFWDFLATNGYAASINVNTLNGFDPMIWSQLMGGSDILRQRVGLALLDQWVVSIDGFASSWRPFVMAAYLDVLWESAFSNYRELMEGVSTSVAMGLYLTFLGSVKANPATGSIPIASGSPLPAGPGTPGPAAQSPTLAAPDAKRDRRRGPVPPERGEFVRERFKATQEWLQNAPDDRYAIQLVTVSSGEVRKLEDFLLRASATVPAGELFVYSVKIDGRQHYRVAYGSYASPERALDAIKGLPPFFSAYHPYYRSIERMRSQNRQ